MRLNKRFPLIIGLSFFAALLAILLTPFSVSGGLRLWLSWKAHQENLTIKIDKIDAPFLRPVVLRGIHIISTPQNAFRFELNAKQAVIHLNLSAIILRGRGRTIRTLSVEDLRAEIHRNHSGTLLSESGWSTLHRLFPPNFNRDRFDLRARRGPIAIPPRNASLSARELEACQSIRVDLPSASPAS